MEFRILGSLQIHDEGQVVELGGGKPRALLAILLLSANRVVSSDVLIESLWGASAGYREQGAAGLRFATAQGAWPRADRHGLTGLRAAGRAR